MKWLLNERAAIAGEHELLQKRIPQLQARVQKLESLLLRMRSELGTRQARFVQTSVLMAALDATLTAAHPEASPEAGGTVKAWAGRYGERGGLRAYVLSCVTQAGAEGVSTTQLIEAAILHFQLPVLLPKERASIRSSVKLILKAMRRDNLVESHSEPQPNGKPLNFWRMRAATSLDQLRVLASAGRPSAQLPTGAGDERLNLDEDTLRGEVAGQRAGCREG